jgi:hypothetical protein
MHSNSRHSTSTLISALFCALFLTLNVTGAQDAGTLVVINHGCMLPNRGEAVISLGILNTGPVPLGNVSVTAKSLTGIRNVAYIPTLATRSEHRLSLASARDLQGTSGLHVTAAVGAGVHTHVFILCDSNQGLQVATGVDITGGPASQFGVACGLVCVVHCTVLLVLVLAGIVCSVRAIHAMPAYRRQCDWRGSSPSHATPSPRNFCPARNRNMFNP